jgi:hypothetical protein
MLIIHLENIRHFMFTDGILHLVMCRRCKVLLVLARCFSLLPMLKAYDNIHLVLRACGCSKFQKCKVALDDHRLVSRPVMSQMPSPWGLSL